jgi:hypothetical protein
MKSKALKQPNTDFQYQVTLALLGFLRDAGLNKKSIETLVGQALKELHQQRQSHAFGAIDPGVASIVGTAYHTWFRNRAYIADNGKPKALRLLGKGASVESLVARESPAIPAAKIVSQLLRLGMLKKTTNGKYLPTALHSIIRYEHPYLSEHVAHSIIRLLATVQYNATSRAKAIPLIERFAHVSSIPKNKVREFKDFTTQQGEALIDTVNDWLEANKSSTRRRKSGQQLQAGLHVFAFVGDRKP